MKALPGMEAEVDEQLEQLAEHYVECRDKRMRASKPEKEAKNALIEGMKSRKKKIYKHDDLTILLKEGDLNVKVKRRKKDEKKRGRRAAAEAEE